MVIIKSNKAIFGILRLLINYFGVLLGVNKEILDYLKMHVLDLVQINYEFS